VTLRGVLEQGRKWGFPNSFQKQHDTVLEEIHVQTHLGQGQSPRPVWVGTSCLRPGKIVVALMCVCAEDRVVRQKEVVSPVWAEDIPNALSAKLLTCCTRANLGFCVLSGEARIHPALWMQEHRAAE
jgi:hypothetical protein